MSKKKVSIFPKEIYVWDCDYNDGEPVFAVGASIEEIAESLDTGDKVAKYVLAEEFGEVLEKELKFKKQS